MKNENYNKLFILVVGFKLEMSCIVVTIDVFILI